VSVHKPTICHPNPFAVLDIFSTEFLPLLYAVLLLARNCVGGELRKRCWALRCAECDFSTSLFVCVILLGWANKSYSWLQAEWGANPGWVYHERTLLHVCLVTANLDYAGCTASCCGSLSLSLSLPSFYCFLLLFRFLYLCLFVY
jgi:hypothetical protein